MERLACGCRVMWLKNEAKWVTVSRCDRHFQEYLAVEWFIEV